MKTPIWLCESHLREIEDLEASGEYSESKVRLSEIMNEYLWCADCKDLRAGVAREMTREWAIAHRLGVME